MTPHVSIVMPIFNASATLSSSIQSIVCQTISDWELLLMDDGSTDGSFDIMRQASRHDLRIKSIANSHQGIVATLNHGIRLSRGEFIARLDADDIALPDRLRRQAEYLSSHRELALVAGGYETITARGVSMKTQFPPQNPEELKLRLEVSNCLAHSSVMFRKSILDCFDGPYRDHFPLAEDYDLWLRMIEKVPIGSLPEVVVQYRRNLYASDPERIVRQTIATIATQLCYQRRRVGLMEDLVRETSADCRANLPVDRNWLDDAGVSRDKIDRSVRRSLISEAKTMRKHGLKAESMRMLRNASQFAPTNQSLKIQLEYLWRVLQVYLTRIERI